MKCQSLSSGKNKKNKINLLSAEIAQRVVKAKDDKDPIYREGNGHSSREVTQT